MFANLSSSCCRINTACPSKRTLNLLNKNISHKKIICRERSVFPGSPPVVLGAGREPNQTSALSATVRCQTCHKSTLSAQQKEKIRSGPALDHFIRADSEKQSLGEVDTASSFKYFTNEEVIPYVSPDEFSGLQRKVYFDTYGCQMNVSDTEIAWSILKKNNFVKTDNIKESDVILVMTCSIREGAETKIWNRLKHLKGLKKFRAKSKKKPPLKIGILGCMAERLKESLIERENAVDIVCGPDAYRDLPRLLATTHAGQPAVNVLLSLEETYADVLPVRINEGSVSAFVSIMRGCDNMCTYCIVPFTRGRERSRPVQSIVEEVKILADQGIKEITLLGQNVNSYRDNSTVQSQGGVDLTQPTNLSRGFSTIYKPKLGGLRFADLLDQVSRVDPELRIRFTSPHPKDFPDEVLHLIRDRDNVCNQLHLPAQSGSSAVLRAMRRGYTREAYLNLVERVREILPGVSLSSDFIAGFCGESEADHQMTVDLMTSVKYNYVYFFPYSMREKTRAFHRLTDDVPQDVKARRTEELSEVFRREALRLNEAQIGQRQLVLIEGVSKRSDEDLVGRNDGNTRVIFSRAAPQDASSSLAPGDYVEVEITGCSSQVLKGTVLAKTTLQAFHSQRRPVNTAVSAN